MTISDLRYFEAVYAYKSISAAASRLHISQPSLSIAIKGLEDEFGVRLFERRHKGVVPTEEGVTFHERVREILRGVYELGEVMHDLGNKRSRIRIGVPPMIGSLLLPRVCGEFLSLYPDIRLDVTEGGGQELVERLKAGEVDMILLSHRGEADSELATTRVTRLRVALCASSEDSLREREKVNPTDLAERRLVLFGESFFQSELIKSYFADCGITPKIILETDQLSTVVSLVESGVAVGFLFDEVIRHYPTLSSVPLEREITVDVSLATKRGAYRSEAMKKLARFLSDL